MHSLPLFHRIAGRHVVVVGGGAMGQAKRRLVERAGGIACSEAEAHKAQLAFVALEDEAEAEKAALRLKRAGLIVNVADRPELCEFTTPSLLDRDPVLIAVSTGGASAGLAKHLRLRLESLLPQSLGKLAAGLAGMRNRMRERFPDGDDRRRAVDAALSEGGILDPFDEEASKRIDDWLAAGRDDISATPETIQLASDDPDDLTIRQARWLGTADTVLHDPSVPEAVLIRARADAERMALPAEPPTSGFTVIVRAPRT